MASETDSFVQSTIAESAETSQKKWRSPVWKYCRTAITEDDEDPDNRYCSYCIDPDQKPYGTDISTNIKRHLLNMHQIVVEKAIGKIEAAIVQQLAQLYLQAETSGQTGEVDSRVLQAHLNPAVINEALVLLIVVQNLPFSIVEWPKFYVLC
jgi:hypothetical protein